MEPKKLFLIDAYALIYRSYFAFIKNPRITSAGVNTSGVFGFVNTLLELVKSQCPGYWALGFDLAEPTFRHKMYPPYKANRPAAPEAVHQAVPYIRRLAQAMRMPIVERVGYEADDVLGTVAWRAAEQGAEVYIMTPDKDYGQLVGPRVRLYKPRRFAAGFDIVGEDEVRERYQIENTRQVIDLLALCGDKSDNVPGVPGVGEKTAAKLITQFGGIDGIMANLALLPDKLRAKFEAARDDLEMARRLVTIVTDVEIDFDLEDARVAPPDMAAVDLIFDELEFRALRPRFAQVLCECNGTAPLEGLFAPAKTAASTATNEKKPAPQPSQGVLFAPETPARTLKDVEHDYKLIDTPEKLAEFNHNFNQFDIFSFDTETSSIDALEAQLAGFSVCAQESKAFYIAVCDTLEINAVISSIKALLEDERHTVIGQNIKYDLLALRKYGVEPRCRLVDTMVAHYLVDPEQRHNLDHLAYTYFQWEKIKTEDVIGPKGPRQSLMTDLAPERIRDYACEDADVTFRLWGVLEPELERTGMTLMFNQMEMPLLPVLADMEAEGARVDPDALDRLRADYQAQADAAEAEIRKVAGYDINIASPKQLGKLLFDDLRVAEKPKKTRTGQYATGEEVLDALRGKHPVVGMVLEHRELQKLLGTYIEALPRLVKAADGRVHTSYNQAATSTGRLSSSNPNLQNIPVRDARGKAIRRAFVAGGPGRALLAADYSQIELRIMAHLSGDQHMLQAFDDDADIHQLTAAKLFGVEPHEVTREERAQAKSANFGIIYGISSFGLSRNTGLSRYEAKELIDNYFQTYPKIKEYMDNAIEQARARGYAATILGRRRYLPDINAANANLRAAAERNAINAPIQGSSADMIKLAMVNIHRQFAHEKIRSRMILQVHDELVFDIWNDEEAAVRQIVEREMMQALPLDVKLKVDIKVADNWLEAH